MSRISGPYPGGPRRPSEEPDDHEPVRVGSGEEVESRLQDRSRRERERRKRRRIVVGLVAFFLVAGGIGTWIGLRSLRTAEEIAAEEEAREQEESGIEGVLRQERNRILRELWKMEDLERLPRPPGR